MKRRWARISDPLVTILSTYCATARWALAGMIGLATLAAASAAAAPLVFARLIDRLHAEPSYGLAFAGFVLCGLLWGCAKTSQNIIQYMSTINGELVSFIAGTSFIERLLRKKTEFFVEHNAAEIQSALVGGQQALNLVTQLLSIVLVPGATQIAVSIGVLGLAIDWTIAAVVVSYGLVFIGLTYLANASTKAFLEAAIAASQQNAKFVGTFVPALETLRCFGGSHWLSSQFRQRAFLVRGSWRDFSVRRMWFAGVQGATFCAQMAVTFALLLPRYRAGDISAGDIVLFNALVLSLNQPFEMVGRSIDDVVRSYARFRPFADIWAAPAEVDGSIARACELVDGRVEFNNVEFRYRDGRGLTGISFRAERGRLTFIAGASGAGKTTVLRLLLKSIEPHKGRITVDGTDLRDIGREGWFSRIGVVPQDIVLLNDSLQANIVLGRPFDEDRLHRAARSAAILDFIEGLPGGFDANVGERGLKLSGGERQRIAIARALYGDPQVLLLDEASSALDEKTEADIMTQMRQLMNDVTIVAVTHRRQIILPSDNVIALEAYAAAD